MGIAAIVGGVSAAASVGSALIGSNAAQNAAQTQANAANQAAATQLQMYQQTRQDLLPWMGTGGSANSQLAYLYGLGPPPGAAGAGFPGGGSGFYTTPTINGYGGGSYPIPPGGIPAGGTAIPGTAGAPSGGTGVPNYAAMTSALENTPGYQFTLNQGDLALDRSAASQGLLLSGGQLKASQQYGQGLAMANAWTPYINELNTISNAGQNAAAMTGQQGTALAGNAGSAQLAGGTAGANGSLLSGLALQNGISGVGGAATSFLQAQYPSSYGLVTAANAYGASPGAIQNTYATDPLANPFAS